MPLSYNGFQSNGNSAYQKSNTYQNSSPQLQPQTQSKPKSSSVITDFPVTKPKYKLSDLIIDDNVRDELLTIIGAQQCWNTVFVRWNLASVLKERKNLFVNFYGDPGTGKTMSAHAVAQALGKEIICVNYADVESKYVGETGKNLNSLFKFAKEKKAIIFFDEADALLSKRVTNMNNATDVSVNQTRSVLLMLLNDYDGMVIFATNFISNYDAAFMRRIQYHVRFRLPNAALRQQLWRMYIPAEMPNNVNIAEIAEKYDGVSGSDISNSVLKAALKAAKNGEPAVKQEYFEEAVKAIIESKKENSGSSGVIVSERNVSEEYAMSQIKKAPISLN